VDVGKLTKKVTGGLKTRPNIILTSAKGINDAAAVPANHSCRREIRTLQIERVETALYRIQRQAGLSNSTQQIDSTSLLMAHIYTDDGLDGVGWTYSHGTSGRGMKEAVDTLLAPRIIGEDPSYIECLYDRMWHSVFPNITMSGLTAVALAPLDIALWDLAAKAAGKPLFQL
jgi:L-alanine-DL-glutamate epimerase-like enolase superfamily enzyme